MVTLFGQKTSVRDATAERTAAAEYIAAMSGDLADLARRHGLDTLGYLLDMARLEADSRPRAGKNVRRAV
jgi:hypothetical protein